MPEREAPDARSAQQKARLTELRAEIDAAGSDTGRLAAVVRALAREEVDDPGEVRELLRLVESRLGRQAVSDLFLEASPWLEPMTEEEELADGETLILFGGWIPNPDRRE